MKDDRDKLGDWQLREEYSGRGKNSIFKIQHGWKRGSAGSTVSGEAREEAGYTSLQAVLKTRLAS